MGDFCVTPESAAPLTLTFGQGGSASYPHRSAHARVRRASNRLSSLVGIIREQYPLIAPATFGVTLDGWTVEDLHRQSCLQVLSISQPRDRALAYAIAPLVRNRALESVKSPAIRRFEDRDAAWAIPHGADRSMHPWRPVRVRR